MESLIQARELVARILPLLTGRFVIAISGESGSGKTTLAKAMAEVFADYGIKATILHQDDYFFLPPKDNELRRKQDISWVGPGEVNLELIANHIKAFRQGQSKIVKPFCIFEQNRFEIKEFDFENAQVLIVEGTYVFMLPEIDYKIFLPATYRQTLQRRIKRGRDNIDEFLDRVLEIEHRIIQRLGEQADVIVAEDN